MLKQIQYLINAFDYLNIKSVNSNIGNYLEFDTEKQIQEFTEGFQRNWLNAYSKKEDYAKMVNAIKHYCGESYVQGARNNFNDYLRYPEQAKPSYKKEICLELVSVLETAPVLGKDIVLYRFVCDSFYKQLLENARNNMLTQEKGILSTSCWSDIALTNEQRYAQHKYLLKIFVKKDTQTIYAPMIECEEAGGYSICGRSFEQELIFQPNANFKLISKPYKKFEKIICDCTITY